MCSAFFSPVNKIKNTNEHSEIIEKLTSIRVSKYKAHKIKGIDDTDIGAIKALVKKLGTNILKANLLGSDSLDTYTNARNKFNHMIDVFITSGNKFDITSYAAQLLQYYTVISDDAFESNMSTEEFDQFLTDNCNGKFGDTRKNAFIVEYKLIKIYNDLTSLTDAKNGKIAPIVNSDEQARLLVDQLIELQKTVTEYTNQAPDNVFTQYLAFVINYTTAKLLELNYMILDEDVEKLAPEDESQLSDVQQYYLALAKQSLTEINDLADYFEERNAKHVKGIEYSFGQEVLHKFPITDLEKATDHLRSLTI